VGRNFEKGEEENAADGHSLDIAGRGKIEIMSWEDYFSGMRSE
jgi:hypothetical protein